MSLLEKTRRLLGRAPRIEVHLMVQGRIGLGWRNVDRRLFIPTGSTLENLIERADAEGLDLSGAIASSPHLAHTLMLNGERCAVEENRERVLEDGDQVYLLAPLAGG